MLTPIRFTALAIYLRRALRRRGSLAIVLGGLGAVAVAARPAAVVPAAVPAGLVPGPALAAGREGSVGKTQQPPGAAADEAGPIPVFLVTPGSPGAGGAADAGKPFPAGEGRPGVAAAGSPLPAGEHRAGLAVRRAGASSFRSLAGALAAAAAIALGVLAWRRRPRRCPACRAAMARLDRAATFAELDMKERTEQLVGDVHYVVWRCPACGQTLKIQAERRLAPPPSRSLTSSPFRRRF